jgi:hypothetical protein
MLLVKNQYKDKHYELVQALWTKQYISFMANKDKQPQLLTKHKHINSRSLFQKKCL